MKNFKVGDLVKYSPYEGCTEEEKLKGKVKSLKEDPNEVFVVFHCNNDWDNYEHYTGQSTKVNYLELGW